MTGTLTDLCRTVDVTCSSCAVVTDRDEKIPRNRTRFRGKKHRYRAVRGEQLYRVVSRRCTVAVRRGVTTSYAVVSRHMGQVFQLSALSSSDERLVPVGRDNSTRVELPGTTRRSGNCGRAEPGRLPTRLRRCASPFPTSRRSKGEDSSSDVRLHPGWRSSAREQRRRGRLGQKESQYTCLCRFTSCFGFQALNDVAGKHDLVQIAIGMAEVRSM